MHDQTRPLVLLMGPPNVGKSVIFNIFTGMNVSCANYPGTTVEYAFGEASIGEVEAILIDVPGIYTLDAANEAETIAVEVLSGKYKRLNNTLCRQTHAKKIDSAAMLQKPTVVLCVLDAYNLASSLYLLLQILEFGLPAVAVLNRSDLIKQKGEVIDAAFLSDMLGIPVISTVAVKKLGLKDLKSTLASTLTGAGATTRSPKMPNARGKSDQTRWQIAEKLAHAAVHKETVSQKTRESFDRRKKLGLLLVKPWPGIPLAGLILAVFFFFVIGVGMGLRQMFLLPIFRGILLPQITTLVQTVTAPGLLQKILIGEYGFLVKGLEWPFTLVLPYIISFYTALTVLEDSGYMSRLGALSDGLLNKIGVHGSSIIPLLLGYGCAVPAILSTRALGSRKERLTVSALICLAVPCVAQTGAFISLLSERSVLLVLFLFIFSGGVLAGAGLILDRLLKGPPLQTLMEIPELLSPRGDVLVKKLWARVKNFITDGALPMIGAVALAAFFYETGIMETLGKLLSPLVTGWLGLPREATIPLVLGILRRELTVLPLLEMELTLLQLFVGAVVGLFYVPCIAVVGTLAREFNLLTATVMILITCSMAFLAGGIVSRVGSFVLSIIA